MSKITDDRIKLSVKSSNYHISSSFSTTEDSIELFLLANNSNLYNWNNPNTGAIIGAELIKKNTEFEHHQPYIAIKNNNEIEKLAIFNKNEITLTGNILPSSNLTYSLGSENMRFNDLYLSGNTIELGDISISVSDEKGLSLTNKIADIAPPLFEGGGLKVFSADGGYAITNFDEKGEYVTKTFYADGTSKPLIFTIYDNIIVKNKATVKNLEITSNAIFENIEIFNTSNNRPTFIINHQNNKYNIIESSNYPLEDYPFITVLSDNNLTQPNNANGELIGKYFSFDKTFMTWNTNSNDNQIVTLYNLRTEEYINVKIWSTTTQNFEFGNWAGRKYVNYLPGDFIIGDRLYQIDPRIEQDFFILDKNANLGLNKQPVSKLDVNGDAYIEESIIINKDIIINRNEIVEGSSFINENSYINGNQIIKGNLNIYKDTILKDLFVQNDVLINNNLEVNSVIINNNLDIKSNLKIE